MSNFSRKLVKMPPACFNHRKKLEKERNGRGVGGERENAFFDTGKGSGQR